MQSTGATDAIQASPGMVQMSKGCLRLKMAMRNFVPEQISHVL